MLASRALRCQTDWVIRATRILAAFGSIALVAVAPVAEAQVVPPPQYIATDTHPPSSVRWKLVLGGVATTAGFYAIAQPFSYAWPDAPGARDLRVPVAGPWMAIANNGCAADDPDCSRFWVWTRGIVTALDGLGQAGGLLIALEGIFLHSAEDEPVTPGSTPKDKPPGQEPTEEPPPRNLFIAPTPIGVGASGVGLSISGMF